MEISKKQFAFYTIFLLLVAGGTTIAFAPPPEELMPLWDRLWKVAEPVSIDDNGDSITIDGLVGLVPDTEVTIAGPITIAESVLINDLDPVDVNVVSISDGDGPITVDGTVNIGGIVNIADGEGSITVDGQVGLIPGTTVTVAEPVSIDDDGGSLSIDDGGGSITVDGTVALADGTEVSITGPVTIEGEVTLDTTELTIAPGTEVRIPGKVITVMEGTLSDYVIHGIGSFDVSGYKQLYIYVYHDGSIEFNDRWVLRDDDGNSMAVSVYPSRSLGGSDLDRIDKPEVMANRIEFTIQKQQADDVFVRIWIYASPV